MRREQRKQEQAEFEAKLKVLQEKTDRLKRELGYKDRNQKPPNETLRRRFDSFYVITHQSHILGRSIPIFRI